MDIRKEDLPLVTEAFQIQEGKEIVITGQVVSSQNEKVKFEIQDDLAPIEEKKSPLIETDIKRIPAYKRHPFLTGLIMAIIVLAIIPVAIYEITKSWIQYYFNQKKKAPSESYSG